MVITRGKIRSGKVEEGDGGINDDGNRVDVD